MSTPFSKILVANRGEIACRVMKTASKMGIGTVAVYSDADREAPHTRLADEAVHIGAGPAAQSYLRADRIIEAARKSGAQAIHPGYGFLSENAAFATACADAGLAFVGPPPKAIAAMGDKITSKKLAAEAGVSTVPGFMGIIEDEKEAIRIARDIGYPVMIKASAGGGGKGMRIAHDDAEVREGFARAKSEAASAFGDDRVFIEKFIVQPRHIEIQVLADAHGNTIFLGERECSIQRRNQKVIEEAPSPFLDEQTRKAMGEQAVALAKAVHYQSAGTVEFIVDQERNFYFLEMNTRLQVEHPVTELITGLDLVELMLRIAAGERLALAQEAVKLNGWAIESRIYAEDPYRNFLPSVGRLTRYRPPAEISSETHQVRNDTGVEEGGEISTFYDPMIAKLCAWAPSRKAAIEAMTNALDSFELEGVGHNIPFLQAVMGQERFQKSRLSTAYIEEEFPNGFNGVEPEAESFFEIAAILAAAGYQRLQPRFTDDGLPKPGAAEMLSVVYEDQRWDFGVEQTGPGHLQLAANGGQTIRMPIPWRPGQRMAEAEIGPRTYRLKLTPTTSGFCVRWRGAKLGFSVVRPQVADLMPLMPVKQPPDMSNFLVCPMPGQIVRLDVEEGAVVEQGQTLAIIEAMKMENVLKAEKRARVRKIGAKVGDVLAVDDIILEFDATQGRE